MRIYGTEYVPLEMGRPPMLHISLALHTDMRLSLERISELYKNYMGM